MAAYHAFHTGYKETQLQPGELISRVRLPRSPWTWKESYRKVGTRKAQAISKVCFAARMRVEEDTVADIRIALGSVAPVPLRCFQTEALLRGANINAATVKAARKILSAKLSPIDDFRSTQVYRRTVAGNLLEKFLEPNLGQMPLFRKVLVTVFRLDSGPACCNTRRGDVLCRNDEILVGANCGAAWLQLSSSPSHESHAFFSNPTETRFWKERFVFTGRLSRSSS
jgi:hypothetical protein